MKRVFDFIVSLLALLILLPVIIITAILVRVKLGSPILFTQDRPGLHGNVFKMMKFRTMLDAVDKNGVQLPDDQRMTAFGGFLRAASLDELPGLINVIKGDMSLVGPRPLLVQYLPLYSTEQARRHNVRPGITGWAQVNGRNAISWEDKFKFDVWYVDNQSFWFDLKIIALTVKKVIIRDGITGHGVPAEHVTLATNSCDTDLFDVDKSVGRNYLNTKLSFVNGRKLITYTGTFGLINKVGYIVELAKAAQKLDPNLCFVAIGDGMEKQQVIADAEKAGVLNNNLYILPPVPKTEIVDLLSAADLSLSLFGPVKEMWHNSANKLFDALASQTPIAINYGGWQKDFINEHNCGLVLDDNDNDYENASKSISSFLNDENEYAKAVESCNVLSYEHFSRDIMAARIESALIDAIKC